MNKKLSKILISTIIGIIIHFSMGYCVSNKNLIDELNKIIDGGFKWWKK